MSAAPGNDGHEQGSADESHECRHSFHVVNHTARAPDWSHTRPRRERDVRRNDWLLLYLFLSFGLVAFGVLERDARLFCG
jgi:hypothetical protein